MAKNGIGRPKKGVAVHTDKIPPLAMEILRAKKVKIASRKRIKNSEDQPNNYYSQEWKHPKLLWFYLGYDLLENQLFARPFILRKYKITQRYLETLLFLYPKGYFTITDYFPISHSGYEVRFPIYLVRDGYAEVIAKPKDGLNKQNIDPRWVYTLSKLGRKIVEEYYELLSGERKFPENTPFDESEKAIDKQRKKLLEKLNALPVSENKKKFFKR